jgi:hypothetical protein
MSDSHTNKSVGMLNEKVSDGINDGNPVDSLPLKDMIQTRQVSAIDHPDVDIRSEILKYLGIQCVYPCNLLATVEMSLNARCILEHSPELETSDAVSQTRFFDRLYEDVIVRYKDNSSLIRVGLEDIRLEEVSY